MTNEELKKLTDEELVHAEVRAERELCQDNLKHRMARLEDTSKLRRIRKEIARIRTFQREREIASGQTGGALRRQYLGTYGKSEGVVEQTAAPASKGFLKGLVDKISGRE